VPRLSLRYPNGRSHVLDYDGPLQFRVGGEFELYGRRWRVNRIQQPNGSRFREPVRVVHCVSLTDSALRRQSR
jgi:hypothetical protein